MLYDVVSVAMCMVLAVVTGCSKERGDRTDHDQAMEVVETRVYEQIAMMYHTSTIPSSVLPPGVRKSGTTSTDDLGIRLVQRLKPYYDAWCHGDYGRIYERKSMAFKAVLTQADYEKEVRAIYDAPLYSRIWVVGAQKTFVKGVEGCLVIVRGKYAGDSDGANRFAATTVSWWYVENGEWRCDQCFEWEPSVFPQFPFCISDYKPIR